MGGAWMGLAAVGRWWRVSCSAPIRPANYSMGCGPRYHALSLRPSPTPRAGSAAQRVPARFSVFDSRNPGVQTRGSGNAWQWRRYYQNISKANSDGLESHVWLWRCS